MNERPPHLIASRLMVSILRKKHGGDGCQSQKAFYGLSLAISAMLLKSVEIYFKKEKKNDERLSTGANNNKTPEKKKKDRYLM